MRTRRLCTTITLPILVLLGSGFRIAGAGDRPVAVGGKGNTMILQNAFLSVTVDAKGGRFAVTPSSSGGPKIVAGRFAGVGEECVVTTKAVVGHPLGRGQAVEVAAEGGDRFTLTVLEGLPFALCRAHKRNTGSEVVTLKGLDLVSFELEPGGVPFEQLRSLGTAGLKPVDGHSGSYAFLAVADPATRAGVVAGWLTHDRGSGVLFSEKANESARVSGRIDYGKLRVAPGKVAASEILAIGCFEDARLGLEAYADAVVRYYGIKLRPQVDGYCTWYSRPHGGASDETHVVELARFAGRELTPFGFDFVQIDDYWQDGKRRNGPAKVFERVNPGGPYPGGMKATAGKLKDAGVMPGIWFMPFAGDRQDLHFADHQDWFVKKPDGSPYFTRWGGTSLDMTHPGAREYLAGIVKRMAHDWGYTYFKMDGMWVGSATKLTYVNNAYVEDDIGEAVFHNPDKTNIEAYRDGIKLVREVAGDDVFFLGCCVSQNMRSFGAAFGLVDAMRIGPDNGSSWGSLKRGPWHGSNRYFLHGRVWYNDPDPVYVRSQMPIQHARLICSWVALSGQLNVSSEWLPGLPADRLDILKRTLPSHGMLPRPVDLFEEDIPRVWLLTDMRKARRDVIGLFNWDEKAPAVIECSLAKLGLPSGRYVGFDYWANAFLPPFERTLKVTVPPASCRVLSVCASKDTPRVASTSRHITQGVVDLVEEKWDGGKATLSGVSRVVADDDYELRIAVQPGEQSWEAMAVTSAPEDAKAGVSASLSQNGPRIRAVIQSPLSRDVRWSVTFRRGAVRVAPPEAVSGLAAEADWGGVRLTWQPGKAEAFRVTRSDGYSLEVTETSVSDTTAEKGRTYRYEVRSVNWAGETSVPTAVEVKTPDKLVRPPEPPEPNVQLSDLVPLAAQTGWGKVGRDLSCQGNPLALAGKRYAKGMGVHAPSMLVYRIPKGAKRFVAVVGIDDEMKKDERSSVAFEVYGDVKEMGEPPELLAKSPPLGDKTMRTWCLDTELSERHKELRLVVTVAGDDNKGDHADWVNAGFVK